MGKDFTPKWGASVPLTELPDAIDRVGAPPYPEHEYRYPLRIDKFPDGVIEIESQPDHQNMGMIHKARFFDGHIEEAPTPLRLYQQSRNYELRHMDRFAWYLHKRMQWGLSTTRDGSRIPSRSDDGYPTEIRPGLHAEPTSMVGMEHERGCQYEIVCEHMANGIDVRWAGRETNSRIQYWMTPHPDDEAAYLEFHLCVPHTDELVRQELPIDGPGAWEYR